MITETTLLTVETTTEERDYTIDDYHLLINDARKAISKVEKKLRLEFTEANEDYHKKLRNDIIKIQRSVYKLSSDYQRKLWFGWWKMTDKYKIVRFYKSGYKKTIHRYVSLDIALSHCNDPRTRKEGVWFDGYTKETN